MTTSESLRAFAARLDALIARWPQSRTVRPTGFALTLSRGQFTVRHDTTLRLAGLKSTAALGTPRITHS